ncbi:MAG TPA: sigma-70 family RNA polymerase sigma factor [Chloroflexota bacterium]|nr:sigma-70 family RNA polymerase sigma factor [Chloroflexota bacterium]
MAVRRFDQVARDGEAGEALLVARAAAGDDRAYEALVERYRDVAVRVARRIAGEEDGEDAAQEALLKAHTHLGDFRLGAPFRPWLLQIVANEAKNRRTAAARRSALERRAAEAATDSGGDGAAIAPPDMTPEAAAVADEERRIVAAALRALREEDRTAIAYRYVHDLSEAEMAAALGIARGTVKSRLSRAMARLRAVAVPALLATLLLALAGGALAIFPRAREVIADRLGLRGVGIEHVPDAPAAPPVGRNLGLGEPVTLDAARARLGFAALLPRLPELGEPDEVYASTEIPGGRLTLLYRPRSGRPAVGATGTGLLITEMRGALDPSVALAKQLGPNTRLEGVTVNGGRGYWIEGQAHLMFFRDANGVVRDETLRLAGNTLLWEQGELTLRVELAGPKEEALRIAESLRR